MTQTNNATWNPLGSRNGNCGPDSLAMALVAFDVLHVKQDRSNAEALIEYVRRKTTGKDDIHAGMWSSDIVRGAQAFQDQGVHSYEIWTMDDLNAALAQNRLAVVYGNPGAYNPNDAGEHFVLILGRTASGGYIMNDPAYEGRPGVVLSATQMANYFQNAAVVYRMTTP